MPYTILIVDDESALRQMLGEILTQAGYRVRSTGSCSGAMESFAE